MRLSGIYRAQLDGDDSEWVELEWIASTGDWWEIDVEGRHRRVPAERVTAVGDRIRGRSLA